MQEPREKQNDNTPELLWLNFELHLQIRIVKTTCLVCPAIFNAKYHSIQMLLSKGSSDGSLPPAMNSTLYLDVISSYLGYKIISASWIYKAYSLIRHRTQLFPSAQSVLVTTLSSCFYSKHTIIQQGKDFTFNIRKVIGQSLKETIHIDQ